MDCDVAERRIVTTRPSLLEFGHRAAASRLVPTLQLSGFARSGVSSEAFAEQVLVLGSGSCFPQLSAPSLRAVQGFSPALPGSGSRGTQEARSQQQSVTPAAAAPVTGSSSTSPAPPSPPQHVGTMPVELDNRCPICLDSWEEASYVMPCLHQFCYACILRWAESKPECPLCKRNVTSILHSVQADDNFKEHVVAPPPVPPVAVHLAGGAPGHPAAHNQPSAAQPLPRAPVGSLHPHVWASLFQEDPALLRPVMLWLRQELWLFFEGGRWETAAARRLVLSGLHLFGLDEETLFQLLQGALGEYTRTFVRQLIDTIVERCGGEARRRMGLEDARAAEEREGSPAAAPGPAASQRGSPAPSPAPSSSRGTAEAEELPSTSSAALRGGPGSPPSAPVPTHREHDEPQEDPEEAVPGPSAPSQGSELSPGGPRRAPKRRAGSPRASSPPSKRPPHRPQ
ncbi:uncharacterized protein LOC115345518 [Aquila chrysaetos chrysaetos]|uniref:uncharacterized protein LOC115345518 n=1 Tax=Aquila chrysaetos chrysaetos TaxID=223781 RepID=UPI0011772082|nr:uncharacterized protein LOC115345518 [Aquila chrysaetos chrysaetos]